MNNHRICTCHGKDDPHELHSTDWCCGEEEDFGFDNDEAAREASRSIDRQNAKDINRENARRKS